MMKRYQAVPHKFYKCADGKIVHFDEESLNLTELTVPHRSVLVEFQRARTREDVMVCHAHGEDISEIIDELIALGLIRDQPHVAHPLAIDLRPKVCAFRIVLTEQCNMRCAECFVTKNRNNLRTMATETLEDVVRQSVPYGVSDRIAYHFFGGEPLIRFDYIKQAVRILEAAVAHGQMVRPLYTITTNLTLLNNEMLSFFARHAFRVGVSVDGPEGINDELRAYSSGRGTFRNVVRNYQQLIKAGIDAYALITPHVNYLDKLPAIFCAILEQFPMKTVSVNTPLHFGTLQWTMPGKRYAYLLVQLLRIAHKLGVIVDSAASPPLAALTGNIRRESPCTLIHDRIMASVGPDGGMSFCSQKWHSYLTVTNVEAGTEILTPIRRANNCAICEARHICGGPCPAYQRISGNKLDNNRCAFMRALLREAVANLDLFEMPPGA